MLQTQRDQVVFTMQCWRRAGQWLAKQPASTRDQLEPVVRSLRDQLALHQSMRELLSSFVQSGGAWPREVPRPRILDSREIDSIVAAAYWVRYQELLARTGRTDADEHSPASEERAEPSSQPLGRLELQYTVKLWQRGPVWLRDLPPDRRARVERLVGRIYTRIAGAKSLGELASLYYGDGEWMLNVARAVLPGIGEPASTASLAQDAACWQRYQELLSVMNAAQWQTRETEARTSAFASWLAAHMQQRRLSVAALAVRLGIGEDVVRGWLQGRDRPAADVTTLLAMTLVDGAPTPVAN